MPDELVTLSKDPDETRALGEELGRLLRKGDLICLYGELGAGKTTFVQGLARGLGVREKYITSPTFSLVNEYNGALRLFHIDLYRLSSPDELEDIGFSEYPGDGVAAVEWPERAAGELPGERLDILFKAGGGDSRKVSARAKGERYEELLEELCRSSRWSSR